MALDNETKSRGTAGCSEALEQLARVEAQVSWLIENWEQVSLESCLDRLAGARRDLSGAGNTLVRDAFVEACVRRADEAEVRRTIELHYRLPSLPAASAREGNTADDGVGAHALGIEVDGTLAGPVAPHPMDCQPEPAP